MKRITFSLILKARKARVSKLGEQIRWSKKMANEHRIEEIEPGIIALGTAYVATLIGMIFWLAAA